MKTYVLYHRDQDGFGAAWAAWHYLNDTTEYISVQYGEPMPEIEDKAQVYIVDFSYDRQTLLDLAARATSVTVIDHHKTAQKDLDGIDDEAFNIETVYDMDQSGCVLTWKYFHEMTPVPRMLSLIQDRDLWRFNLKGTKELFVYLSAHKQDFYLWTDIRFALDRAIEAGGAMLKYQQKQVDNIVKYSTYETELAGHKVAACNSCIFQSEIGHAMLDKFPEAKFAVIYNDKDERVTIYSMRSRGDFDVSDIARAYGGGGHKAAAGFQVNRVERKL